MTGNNQALQCFGWHQYQSPITGNLPTFTSETVTNYDKMEKCIVAHIAKSNYNKVTVGDIINDCGVYKMAPAATRPHNYVYDPQFLNYVSIIYKINFGVSTTTKCFSESEPDYNHTKRLCSINSYILPTKKE